MNAEVQNEFLSDSEHFKVLILDDELKKGKLIEDRIKGVKNCSTFVCVSEYSALKLLKEENFNLIIIDVELKNFDGLDFGRSIRTLIRANIPIMFFSSNPSRQVDYYLECPENSCFVEKLFEGSEFQDKFLEMIDAATNIKQPITQPKI